MRKIILPFILSVMISPIFAQQKCDKSSIETLIQDKLAESKQKESVSQENYEKAVDELAKLKKWDSKQKLDYLMKMVSTESFQKSTTQKYATLQEVMTLLQKVDATKATTKNCEIKSQVEQKVNQVIASNGTEWDKVMAQVKKDYKAIAKKDLVIGKKSSKKNLKKSANPFRPPSIVGTWIDITDKESNYVFKADGTVYDQAYGTTRTFNQRYWYAKNGKIHFTFSNQTEGGIGVVYSIKGDVLELKIFGETIKYQKKK